MQDGSRERGRFEQICEASPDVLVLVDAHGEITYANARISDVFGYAPEDVEGEPVELLVPEEFRDAHVDQRDAYLAAPETRPMGAGLELSARRTDGETFPVEISLSPIEFSDHVEVLAAVRDVTEHESLRRKYRTILETAPDAVVVADADTGRIVETNDHACRLLGYWSGELVGKRQTDLHPSGEIAKYEALFEHHVENDREVIAQFPDGDDVYVETKDGRQIPVEINAQVFEHGDRRLVTGIFRDLSERRARQRELENQVEQLEQLANVLAHDLRNPLEVATAHVEMARATGNLDELDGVEVAHERIAEILENALTLARNGQALSEVDLEPTRLDPLVTACWGTVATAGATLVVEDDATLLVDMDRVHHLFENLFRNAIEHAGSEVAVRVGLLPDRSGFFFEDDGPGIPEAERDEVFESGYTTAEGGTGFGLPIVKTIANAHDWRVSITEGRDGGARFEFTGVEFV